MDLPITSSVIISGASGMLGKAVRLALSQKGVQCLQLVRRNPAGEGELAWNPATDEPIADTSRIEGAAAAIHLSGANVAAHRWTDRYREEIATSRVTSTKRLAAALARLRNPPKALLVASAIGIYGDRGDELLDENSTFGEGFLAQLCRDWEAAAAPAREAGIRVVHLRFGVVLGPGEGALQQMLPLFRSGLGARIGDGRQWMSWVGLVDVSAAVMFALGRPDIEGPVNVTAPNPVTNAEFTNALARQLGRPAIFSVPAFAVKLLFGQMGKEALLASARVQPRRLLDAGFRFSMPGLEQALSAAIKK